jgi:ergothioneine biosynthesis protein EgtB
VAVEGYVQRVRRELDDGLQNVFSSMPPDSSASLLLNVAIEHRLMHAETLAYMLHQLPFARKIKQSPNPELVTPPPKPKMIEIPAGTATLGLARDGGVFGWDNEFERVEVSVPAFAIDQFMVTNAQFLEFMSAGGYQNPALWSPADWGWRSERRVCHPVFWRQSEEGWLQRTMFEEIPLPPHWPVYVSHAEASAYARWTGKSLPSEEQWDRAAFATREGFENRYPWGNEAPDESRGNFDFHSWDPVSVAAHSPGESALGVAGLLGNGWEWTSTVFGPLPGFEPFPFYRGYSADFFDGKHYAMKGGSMRTAASMLRRSFRNWFQAHYQYVYAGFRCVSN